MLADLDAGTWRFCSADVCRQLAEEVVNQVRSFAVGLSAGRPGPQLPNVPTSVTLNDLDLTVRTYNCLTKAGFMGSVSGLSTLRVFDLLKWRNFGVRSLVDLLTSLEGYLGSRPGVVAPPDSDKVKTLQRHVRAARRLPGILGVTVQDVRFGIAVRALGTGAASLGEALDRLEAESNHDVDLDAAVRHLRELRRGLSAAARLTIEDEIDSQLTGLTDRNKDVLRQRRGWDGTAGGTLEEVGERFGLTRERVRQVVVGFEKRLSKRGRQYMPVLDGVLDSVMDRAPAAAAVVETDLAAARLTRKPFRLEGLRSAAEAFGRSCPWTVIGVNGGRLVVPSGLEELPRQVLSAARRSTEHWGLIQIDDLAARVGEKAGVCVSASAVEVILSVQPGFHWLLPEEGWCWLSSVARNRVVNQIRKILSVMPSVSIGEIRQGVGRPHRMSGYSLPKRVLLELCRQLPVCAVHGEVVEAIPDVLPESLSPAEWALLKVIKQMGGIGRRTEIEERSVETGVSLPMTTRLLSYASWIAKYATGVYGLRGGNVEPAVVEGLRPSGERARIRRDSGWTADGRPWLASELTDAILSTGIIYMPSAFRRALLGTYALHTVDNQNVGQVRVRDNGAWGLHPFFARYGGEEGEVLLLVFEPTAGRVVARLGGEELLDRVNDLLNDEGEGPEEDDDEDSSGQ